VTAATSNPLLTEMLCYQMPPFDKIKDEHFNRSGAGIAEEEKEAEAILKQTDK
jgi:hypothetical protein